MNWTIILIIWAFVGPGIAFLFTGLLSANGIRKQELRADKIQLDLDKAIMERNLYKSKLTKLRKKYNQETVINRRQQ